jgi:hypothetical protein
MTFQTGTIDQDGLYIWTLTKIRITAAMGHSNLIFATIAALHSYYKLTKFQQRMANSSRDAISLTSAGLALSSLHYAHFLSGPYLQFRCYFWFRSAVSQV